MSMGGWIFMLASWGVIVGLFIYCMVRTLCGGKKTCEKKGEE